MTAYHQPKDIQSDHLWVHTRKIHWRGMVNLTVNIWIICYLTGPLLITMLVDMVNEILKFASLKSTTPFWIMIDFLQKISLRKPSKRPKISTKFSAPRQWLLHTLACVIPLLKAISSSKQVNTCYNVLKSLLYCKAGNFGHDFGPVLKVSWQGLW